MMALTLGSQSEMPVDRRMLIQNFLNSIDLEEVLASALQYIEQAYEENEAQAPDLETGVLEAEFNAIKLKVQRGELDQTTLENQFQQDEAENKVIDTLVHGLKKIVKFSYYYLVSEDQVLTLQDIYYIVESSLKKCPAKYQEFMESLEWSEYAQEFYWDIVVSKDLNGLIESDPLEAIAIDSITHGLEQKAIARRIAAIKNAMRARLKNMPIPDICSEVLKSRLANLQEDFDCRLEYFSDFTVFESILLQHAAELVREFPTDFRSFFNMDTQSPHYQHLSKYLPLIEKYKENLKTSATFPIRIKPKQDGKTILLELISFYIHSTGANGQWNFSGGTAIAKC